jgi:hypothetical protein
MRGNRKTKYARRERDFEFMGFVRGRTCLIVELPPFLFIGDPARAAKHVATTCRGKIEADHLGERGIGQKAPDNTCGALCQQHHHERTNHYGIFKQLVQLELRAWRAEAISRTQTAWRARR